MIKQDGTRLTEICPSLAPTLTNFLSPTLVAPWYGAEDGRVGNVGAVANRLEGIFSTDGENRITLHRLNAKACIVHCRPVSAAPTASFVAGSSECTALGLESDKMR